MRTLIAVVLSMALAVSLLAQYGPAKTKSGLEVLIQDHFKLLEGKRVGIVTNPTAITSDVKHIVEVFQKAPGVKVTALFGPEHGVRGDIPGGGFVATYTDEKTGLPVYSLYGRSYKPTPEMLKDVDILVYDIQDIGVRSYTFISTLGYIMEAAAENGKEVIVLDRPNPLRGDRVEGSILDMNFKSFIGFFPIPYVYGMTVGELARMINGERWLKDSIQCKLTVVPLKNWKRSMTWEETGLPWVPTSPHIPHPATAMYYVITGTMGELQTVNHGVGYTMPFELIGASWIDGQSLSDELNSRKLKGILFSPLSFKPFYFDTSDVFYRGVQIHIRDPKTINLMEVQLSIMDAILKLYPDSNFIESAGRRINAFDRANGGDAIRKQLLQRTPVAELMKNFEKQVKEFNRKREKYLLYR
jgi:uncharacterized protein YbbC (DUF1343 family)